MLVFDDVYACPVCDNVFKTEYQARECLEGHEIEVTFGFVCGCGRAFTSNLEAMYHASTCPEAGPGCQSCNNFVDGKRHAPCMRSCFDEDMSPCDEYRKVKVAL